MRGARFSFNSIAACGLGAVEGIIRGNEQRLQILLMGIEDGCYSHTDGDGYGKTFERMGWEQPMSRSRCACIRSC